MPEPIVLISLTLAALAGIVIAAAAALRGWTGWLEVKRIELARQNERSGSSSAPARGELAHLKERVRRLEAIAAGVDF